MTRAKPVTGMTFIGIISEPNPAALLHVMHSAASSASSPRCRQRRMRFWDDRAERTSTPQ